MKIMSIPDKSLIESTCIPEKQIECANIICSIEDKAMDREAEICEFGDISSCIKYNTEYGGDYELWNQISFQKDSTAISIPDFEKEFRRKPLWLV